MCIVRHWVCLYYTTPLVLTRYRSRFNSSDNFITTMLRSFNWETILFHVTMSTAGRFHDEAINKPQQSAVGLQARVFIMAYFVPCLSLTVDANWRQVVLTAAHLGPMLLMNPDFLYFKIDSELSLVLTIGIVYSQMVRFVTYDLHRSLLHNIFTHQDYIATKARNNV